MNSIFKPDTFILPLLYIIVRNRAIIIYIIMLFWIETFRNNLINKLAIIDELEFLVINRGFGVLGRTPPDQSPLAL